MSSPVFSVAAAEAVAVEVAGAHRPGIPPSPALIGPAPQIGQVRTGPVHLTGAEAVGALVEVERPTPGKREAERSGHGPHGPEADV